MSHIGTRHLVRRAIRWQRVILTLLAFFLTASSALAFNLRVVDGVTGADLGTAFRYLVQVDNTFDTTPGDAVTDQISFAIHNSHAPLAMLTSGEPAQGHSTVNSVTVDVPHDGTTRYYVSVLPNSGYAVGGAQVPKTAGLSTEVVVFVEPIALPTAQIATFVFKDHWPINNSPDSIQNEPGIGGATLIISDAAGPLWQDAFGNPIGTIYDRSNPACLDPATFDPDLTGSCVLQVGSGVITTLTNEDYCAAQGYPVAADPVFPDICDTSNPPGAANPMLNPYNLMPGEAVVKFIPPGKYGIVIIPPSDGKEYVLTSTIEGTPTVDAWVQADEAQFFIEQFGAASPWHAFYGLVTPAELPWAATPPAGPGSISGENRFMHFARPPNNQSNAIGPPVDNCWVGVNDGITGEGLYVTACNPDSTFTIDVPGVPEGSYELVTWDTPLDALFGFHPVTVPETVDALGQPLSAPNYALDKLLLSSRWFGTLKGNVFVDSNENGFRDAGEIGLQDQAVNIRFRDGTIYQATVSDPAGDYELAEVFPFFKWLVVEVDFLRYKATGMTAAADMGGTIPLPNGWLTPSFGALTPQPQTTDGTFTGPPIVNPNTGNNLSRTETGEVLTQAMQLYLTQTNAIDWGKNFYLPGENGGISGLVYYAVTRAEDDPRYAAAEPWEPGIPNVQITLYHDDVPPYGKIDCLNNTTGMPEDDATQQTCTPELADVDNSPQDNFPGPEDVDHNSNGSFDYGDAVQITYTDSWDASKPTGCIQDLPVIHGSPVNECYDGYGTWNQVRPGVFDGGYAFADHYERSMAVGVPAGDSPIALQSGTYIVEASTPHGYTQVREEDKNVDFGDEFVPSPNVLPAVCVGDQRVVPDFLSLWTDESVTPPTLLPDIAFTGADLAAPFAGETRPLCDRKQVQLTSSLNAAAEFFFFTKVPIAARGVGFINNDLAPEFNMASPAFGEKMAPSWLPVSLRDWAGRPLAHTYSDEFGSYEFLVPGSYTVNQASPTGVTLGMYNIIINDPLMPDPGDPVNNRIPDPWHSPDYAVTPWTFQFETGKTSYIDSPIVPTAGFVGYPQGNLDVFPAAGVPLIGEVTQGNGDPGALACNVGDSIIISSPGEVAVPNPDYDPAVAGSTPTILRDFGFGAAQGTGSVVLNGVALTVTEWTNTSITATVGAGVTSGNLVVTRDNGSSTLQAVSVLVGDCSAADRFVAENGDDDPAGGSAGSPYATIQYAIDQASPGDRIFVGAGTYNERVILYKELALQGSGSDTIINARPAVQSLVQVWRDKLAGLGGLADAANEIPGIMVTYPGDNATTNNNGAAVPNVVIDGFQITGGTTGGGIYILDHGTNAIVRNNIVTGNQGIYSGGITVGLPAATLEGNSGIQILNNRVLKNSGVAGGGGISLYSGSDDYVVRGNIVIGNLSRQFGGGISHQGYSPGGLIQANVVAFNEVFYFAANGGAGGGIFIGNEVGGIGSGTVTVDANLIQGNLSGSSFGGGIRVSGLNTDQDIISMVGIYNNMIANNAASIAGGGISLQDAANVEIINNTVAHNDSTSTAQLAFPNTNLNPSTPRPAGIQAGIHSAALAAALPGGTSIPDPTLYNNIVYQNRSYFHQGLNVGGDALAFHGYWDLGITGQAGPVAPLNPDFSVLTSLSGENGEDYDDGTNLTADPAFASGYFNSLVSAVTLDEGGNNISVRFDELDLMLGNYHLSPGSSATEVGTTVDGIPILAIDYDGDARPASGVDIGADELTGAGPSILTLLTPYPGQILIPGETYTISWLPDPAADNYRLFYFDADNTPHLVATGQAGTSYQWTVPTDIISEPGKRFRITAFDGTTRLGVDWINGPFTVAFPGGSLVTPNGGEVLVGGSTFTVGWTSNPAANNYRLRYFDAAGNPHVVANVGNVTSYQWTIPITAAPEPGTRFRVAAFNDGTLVGVDWSDSEFTLSPTTLAPGTLLFPNNGEILQQNGTYMIYWTPVATAESYRLFYFDADNTPHSIAAVRDATSFAWTVPADAIAEAGKRFRITAFDANNNRVGIDWSDLPFSIVAP